MSAKIISSAAEIAAAKEAVIAAARKFHQAAVGKTSVGSHIETFAALDAALDHLDTLEAQRQAAAEPSAEEAWKQHIQDSGNGFGD